MDGKKRNLQSKNESILYINRNRISNTEEDVLKPMYANNYSL